VVLSDGGIALIEGQQQRIIRYDVDGREALAVGRQGQGPGEFETASALWETPEGGLEVYDSRLGRFTEFASDGSLVGIETLANDRFARPPPAAWRLDSLRVLAWEYNIGAGEVLGGTSAGQRWGTMGVLRVVDLRAGSADTLRVAPAWETIREGSRLWMAPFAARASVAVRDGQVFFTTGQAHDVEILALSGRPVATFRLPSRDGPVLASTLSDLEAEGRARSAADGITFQAGVIFDQALQPDIRPAFEDLKVDPSGAIWAQRHEPFQEDVESWWIIGTTGAYRGLVQLPERTRLLAFGPKVMLVLRLDALDVPSVEVWPMPVVGG